MKQYYLGLDIGTNSVGWAVTDPEYHLCEFRKKDMWGIRLFEDAQTAETRRTKRTNRRRLQRRAQRIGLLQELFAKEMAKVDSTFFLRLNESKLHLEDKTIQEKHPLFIDHDYTDIDYYKRFPTMYHLRKDLIDNPEGHDIRLVYLAIHHILKNRGHFLIDGDLSNAKNFKNVYENLWNTVRDELNLDIDIHSAEQWEKILRDKGLAKSKKANELGKLIEINTEGLEKDHVKKMKASVKQLCALIVGNQGDINKLFQTEFEDIEKSKFKFSDSAYDEEITSELAAKIPDQFYVIQCLKAVYDWSVLVDILAGKAYLSSAKVKQYETHKRNLQLLRKIIKKYCGKNTYNYFFNDQNAEDNYAAYIGHVKKNGKTYSTKTCAQEDFYKALGKLLKQIEPAPEDEELVNDLRRKAETQELLPLQRSKENGVIPNQVHKEELKRILENACAYLPFLKEQDDKGLTVAEKILSIFTFRIPYYVGPLSGRHVEQGANAWMKRKAEGKIYPWNYEEKIDLEQSNEAFIKRMTNKCTYLMGEDVLPKNSLLYTQFMVLNELNNLKIRGKAISVGVKQEIYKELFQAHTKVTGKRLLAYLQAHHDSALEKEDLSGFDQDFKASLSTYLDFEKQVFGERMAEDKVKVIVEDIIKWATIYGDDKKMLKNVIEKNYPGELNQEQINAVSRLRYSGWGNFSKKFLDEIEGVDRETGQQFTILQALWETNNNLMQLLSKNFTFKENIDRYNAELTGEITEISYDALVKDLYTSPANKRAIWQTIQITEEVKKIMGCAPEKIFVEMARGGEKDKQRKASRKNKLLDLYAGCEKDVRDWEQEISAREERDFNSMKLYLYYTQMGKCMYTGKEINLDELMSANSRWDKDHIYPKSKIKDDSIDNLVLVDKTVNSKKSNELLSPEIQRAQRGFWKSLLQGDFISQKKYDRLIRGDDFTVDELTSFISRQLVETRQSSKAVAELLGRMYAETKIVYVKAGLVSQFRKDRLGMLKSRRVNDHHHAQDAYLNIVVGNVYDTKFTSNPMEWMRKNYRNNYSINRIFDYDVVRNGDCAWKAYDKDADTKGQGTLETIRKTMRQHNILYTEYSYCEKGELFNETIARKGDKPLIPIKKDLDPGKYGGYKSPNTAYFALIEFDGKKGTRTRQIIEVPIYVANRCEQDLDAVETYFETVKGLKNVRILRDQIKKNTLILVDGFPMRIRGANVTNLMFKGNVQLVVSEKYMELIRKIEKYLDHNRDFDASEKYDGFTDQELNELYDIFVDKLVNTIYQKRPANQGKKLIENRDTFQRLASLQDKAKILNEILTMLRCDITTTADLKIIKGSANAGNMAISKNTMGKSRLVLINQSVTGLFENRIEL
ncbi:type II CRISPR RNA-guided endonuclease Cas9 [Clostridiales bacterium]|nr:type II CRISPR RNA-guided endonuclease Cas9 [Clostridiales bacterium]